MVDEAPPLEEIAELYPPDETGEPEGPAAASGSLRSCLACGTSKGCDHREHVRFTAPSPALERAIARLRQATAEQRAAARAVRALALSEHARGRAELEMPPDPSLLSPPAAAPVAPPVVATIAPPDPGAPPTPTPAAEALCPRCSGCEPPPPATPATSSPAPRLARKTRLSVEQQAFAFVRSPAPEG